MRYYGHRQTSPAGRVVYRSNNTTNANGGVSYANANNAPSNSNANIGSRLIYHRRRISFCLPFYRPTPSLDVSLRGAPRGMSPTKSSRMAGKVKKHVHRAGFGRHFAEEAGPGERKAMRREKDIMKEVVSYPNIYAAIDEVLSGTRRKSTREGRDILEHRDEVIARLQQTLADGSFQIGSFYEKNIIEAGKLRRIQVLSIETRIGANAVMRVVDEHLRRRFIRTTGASIKGRGMHDLMRYLRDDRRRDPQGTAYCYKADIRKFYESIDQDAVKAAIRRVFKDPVLLMILDRFIGMMPHGLSVGLRSSQGLANLLLSIALDHPLKDADGIPYYYRYCDDIVILGPSKRELWAVRDRVHQLVAAVGLEIKPDERVFPSSEGIDFLGYVVYSGEHVELRKRIKQNMARHMASVKSRRRRNVLIASFYGITKHADCNNLFHTLTGKDMKSFKDLGVSYAPVDGKKHFPGVTEYISDLVNLPIIVRDYETGIKTSQGEDRTLVAIEHNGVPKKFFTSSIELRNILDQIRELPDGFPFETTIRAEKFGKGKTKYIFT